MAGKRRVKGDRSFRKILRRLPDSIRDDMVTMLDEFGDEALAIQQADAPLRSGKVRGALRKKLTRGRVRLQVGLIGKPVNRKLFYAGIVERGRQAKTVIANRRGAEAIRESGGRSNRYKAAALSKGVKGVYNLRVGAMPPRPFIRSKKLEAKRDTLGGRLNRFWDRVLTSASSGASDD